MKEKKVPKLIKEMRGKQHQQQLGVDVNVSRETISKYENGRSKLPADIGRALTQKYDNPKFAITLRNEYTGTGPRWLDGPNVDLHRSSVKEKTIEEMREALDKLEQISLAKPLCKLDGYEKQDMEMALEELVELQTALDHLVAVICMEADISYTGLWDKHYRYLTSVGYLKGGGTVQ